MPENAENQNSSLKSEVETKIPEQELVSWIAASRPFKRRDRQFYITIFVVAGVVGLILFLVEGWIPVVLIISLVFLFYVMSTVPPDNIEYKITNKGVKMAERRTNWEDLGRFWFTRRLDNELLVIETFKVPGRVELIIDPGKKTEIQETLSKYLTHEEIPPSQMDKLTTWFSKKLPQ